MESKEKWEKKLKNQDKKYRQKNIKIVISIKQIELGSLVTKR